MAYSFSDSALSIILADTLAEKLRSDAGLILTPNTDGIGFTARVLSGDATLEFSRAGHMDPVEAISIACARANDALAEALAEDDETIEADDD